MSGEKVYVWRPREFRTPPVDGLDIDSPVGIGSEMYFHSGEDEDGNAVFDQVGRIRWPDPSNKTVYEVTYYPEYEGPREYETQESKDAREAYEREIQQGSTEEPTGDDAPSVPNDNGVESIPGEVTSLGSDVSVSAGAGGDVPAQ